MRGRSSDLLRTASVQLLAGLLLASAAAGVEIVGGSTTLRFEASVLEHLGIEVVDASPSALPLGEGGLGFRVAPGSWLELGEPAGDLVIGAADLGHVGTFGLRRAGLTIPFGALQLRPAAAPYELALVDGTGRPLLLTSSTHYHPDPAGGGLRLSYADLTLAPDLADRLGRPRLAGHYLGALEARYEWSPEAPAAQTQGATTQGGGSCTPNIGPPIDLELIDLDLLTQGAREPGGRIAMAPRAELSNLGPGDAEWGYSIDPDHEPDGAIGPHPFLALAFYRISAAGVLEQIGRADVKHAFFSINTGCPCSGDNVMYVGCDDVYGVNTNLLQRYLGPREEIDALSRGWVRVGSHFDGPDSDDVRSHFSGDHDDFEHRLVVHESDLQWPGARYFYEAWYLAAGDSQLGNSLGHREVAPDLDIDTWLFPEIDSGLETGSILDVWVDPGAPPAGSDNRWLDTGEGRLQLAVRSEDLGGGLHRYSYVLMNFDFERQIRSFHIPLAPGQTVSDIEFSDSDSDTGNDWSPQIGPASLSWNAGPGDSLDWGGLFGFRVVVDGAPVTSRATLSVLEPGDLMQFSSATLGPAAAPAAIPALGPGALALLGASLGVGAWLWRRRGSVRPTPNPTPEDRHVRGH